MTAHEFARQLLAGPDLPIVIQKVEKYSEDDENCSTTPIVVEEEGYNNVDECPCRVLLIDRAFDEGEAVRPTPAKFNRQKAPRPPFEEWLAEMKEIAITKYEWNRTAAGSYFTDCSSWRDYYNDGLTPAEALGEDLNQA